jgi:glycosyltransferase involved in cell wall biosynthesis
MKIAMLSWLEGAPVPPPKYGGIERMVGILTAELVRQGHEVHLIAPIGSFVPGAHMILTNNFIEANWAIRDLKPDIVHDHSCWSLESPARKNFGGIPHVSTTHVMHAVGHTRNVVYLSDAQKKGHAAQTGTDLRSSPTIRVPTNPALKPIGLNRSDYLLYLGAVQRHKGVTEAARLAQSLGRRLIVAGPAAGDYADEVASYNCVEMVGEVGDPIRSMYLEQAYAVMCLHNDYNGWSEPGCGVIGEAGAFNTPVAALRNGCLPELVRFSNGWIGKTWQEVGSEMALRPVVSDPGCYAREEWAVEKIVHEYLSLYELIIGGYTWG